MGAALCRQTGLVHYEGFSSQREAACLNAGMVGFSWCRSALVALKVLGGIWYATALDTFPYFSGGLPSQLMAVQSEAGHRRRLCLGCHWNLRDDA